MELRKGETIMMNVSLRLPAAFLHKAFSARSGVPPDHFELYYRGKRLEGEVALSDWGVEKDSTIEVKMRGRGGADRGDDGGDGVDGGGGGGGGGISAGAVDGTVNDTPDAAGAAEEERVSLSPIWIPLAAVLLLLAL